MIVSRWNNLAEEHVISVLTLNIKRNGHIVVFVNVYTTSLDGIHIHTVRTN